MWAPHALTAVSGLSEGARMRLAVPPDTEVLLVPPLLLANNSGPKDLSRLLTSHIERPGAALSGSL